MQIKPLLITQHTQTNKIIIFFFREAKIKLNNFLFHLITDHDGINNLVRILYTE